MSFYNNKIKKIKKVLKIKMKEEGIIKTTDNKKIDYTLNEKKGKVGFLLLHQLNNDKESYNLLSEELPGMNIRISFRGHGESSGAWQDFTERQFNEMILDAKAALDKLGMEKVIVIGSSIGANIALNLTYQDERIIKTILLSPGINYKGISTIKSSEGVKKSVLIIVSEEDKYSFESSSQIKENLLNGELLVLQNSGHGTKMLTNPKCLKKIMEFVKIS